MILRVGVIVSGRGSNLQAILDASAAKRLNAEVVLVVTNRADVPALERAERAGVKTETFLAKDRGGRVEAQIAMAHALVDAKCGLVVLAGFDQVLADDFFALLDDVPVINIHPSLLPAFGGKGMLGEAVHTAVLASGTKETGCTVHYVKPGPVDGGEILLQRRVPVLPGDDAPTLAARVLAAEHVALVDAVGMFVREKWPVAAIGS